MKEQIEEMREIGILSVVLSTNGDVFLPVGEAKHKLVLGAAENFSDAKFQKMSKSYDSPLHICVTLSVTPSRLGSTNKFSVDIWEVVPAKFLKRIAKEQVHILQNSRRPLDFGFLILCAGFLLE